MGVLIDASVLIDSERGRVDLEKHVKGRESEDFGRARISFSR